MSAPDTERAPADEPSEGGYLRVLSLLDATLLVVGCIIGGGIFFNPQKVAGLTGDSGGALLAWGAGGAIALAGALVYAELGGAFPRAGGVYVYLREAFGRLPAFLFAWSVLLIIAPGALALIAIFFAQNLRTFVPALGVAAERWVASAVIAVLALVNVRGVVLGSRVQGVFTLGKLAAFVLIALAGLCWSEAPLERFAGAAAAPPRVQDAGLGGVWLALVPILFSYGGWQNATFVAAEVREPRRNVPRAMLIGAAIVVAVYLSVNAAFLRIATPDAIAAEPRFATLATKAALGPIGARIVSLGILLSTFGICAAILLANPRLVQAIAADGCFFRALAPLHPSRRTPARAILALGAWAIVLVWVPQTGGLTDAVVFADWVFFGLCGLAVIVLRRKLPHIARPYACPLYPWLPLAFSATALAVVVAALYNAASAGLALLAAGAGLLALGLPVYAAFQLRRRRAG
jgi:APA family basic amino acid/polyamine antiporter